MGLPAQQAVTFPLFDCPVYTIAAAAGGPHREKFTLRSQQSRV
jgi:hypothetical protein